jgi:hypothetical protein
MRGVLHCNNAFLVSQGQGVSSLSGRAEQPTSATRQNNGENLQQKKPSK